MRPRELWSDVLRRMRQAWAHAVTRRRCKVPPLFIRRRRRRELEAAIARARSERGES